jgi:hypothetical protein
MPQISDGTGTAPVRRVPWNRGNGNGRQPYLQFIHLPCLQPLFRSNHTFRFFYISSRIHSELTKDSKTPSSCWDSSGTLNSRCQLFYIHFFDVCSGGTSPWSSRIVGLALWSALRGGLVLLAGSYLHPSCTETDPSLFKHSVGFQGGKLLGCAAFAVTWKLRSKRTDASGATVTPPKINLRP